ncbi:MAG TPA: Hpt domain-containing protein [Nitrospiraceae bacterium]|jgi:HPt (histidine-containing phosphotransfer) domain-containing protein|nr:Hpt domain-containing protein [Nitrospiraceae bacterium]
MNSPTLDLSAVLERLDGDYDLFVTLAELFIRRCAGDLAAIQSAMQAGDFQAMTSQAHKLKGSAMEFCAYPAVAAAKALEEQARSADMEQREVLCRRVEVEVTRLSAELTAIIEKGFPS